MNQKVSTFGWHTNIMQMIFAFVDMSSHRVGRGAQGNK